MRTIQTRINNIRTTGKHAFQVDTRYSNTQTGRKTILFKSIHFYIFCALIVIILPSRTEILQNVGKVKRTFSSSQILQQTGVINVHTRTSLA